MLSPLTGKCASFFDRLSMEPNSLRRYQVDNTNAATPTRRGDGASTGRFRGFGREPGAEG